MSTESGAALGSKRPGWNPAELGAVARWSAGESCHRWCQESARI